MDAVATRKDVDDILQVLDVMVARIDNRFQEVESKVDIIHVVETKLDRVINQIDSIEKRMEISEDERVVINFQLERINDWIENAATLSKVKFAR